MYEDLLFFLGDDDVQEDTASNWSQGTSGAASSAAGSAGPRAGPSRAGGAGPSRGGGSVRRGVSSTSTVSLDVSTPPAVLLATEKKNAKLRLLLKAF